MIMKFKILNITVVLLGFIWLLPSMVEARSRPDFPVPPAATVTWVGEDIVWNGIPMSVRKFTTSKSQLKVRDFYKQEWKSPVAKGLPGFIEDVIPGAWLISRIENGYLMTVQIKTSGSTWGYLGITDLDNISESSQSGKGFPRMSGSQVMNEVKHKDPYRDARTVLLTNNYSVSSNVQYYRNHYEGQGWNIIMDQGDDTGSTHTMMLKKQGSEVSLTVVKTGLGSQVVANIVE